MTAARQSLIASISALMTAATAIAQVESSNTRWQTTVADPSAMVPTFFPALAPDPTPPKVPGQDSAAIAEPLPGKAAANNGRVSLNFGATVVSKYIWRGYLIEDQGFMFQPYAEIGFQLLKPETDGDLAINATLGTWNSLHSEHTGSTGGNVMIWNESDLYGSVAFGWDHYTVGVVYTFYNYPNNSNANTVQEVGFKVGFNLPDDQWYGKWLGDPSVGVYVEVDNSNVGQDDAAYFELNFGPSFDLFAGKATLSIPATLGLSLNNYYVGAQHETFGFFSFGASLEIPLASGEFGKASLTGGVSCLVLGKTTEAIDHGDSFDAYAFVGLKLVY